MLEKPPIKEEENNEEQPAKALSSDDLIKLIDNIKNMKGNKDE